MYHLLTCVHASNFTSTDLAMPTPVGVNCAKTGRNLYNSIVEDSMKKKSPFYMPSFMAQNRGPPTSPIAAA